jgi:hypothetical protein
MSMHILNSLRFSGGILSIYCLSLAIVPIASADTNVSNASGFNVSQASGLQVASFNSFAPASASVGGNGGTGTGDAGDAGTVATGEPGSKGAKSNAIFGSNRQANIRNAQGLQARLDAAQSSYDSASARVAQLLANSSTPAATPDSPKLSAVRFALKPSPEGDCGCNNPDVAAVKPVDNNAAELAARELAAAKDNQAKAATELADAQAQARQFLASAKAPQVAQNTVYSPVW